MKKNEIAVFGGGCFWCTEAVFSQLKGVSSVLPGYAGGILADPGYHEVCMGTTGHAEVIKIEFDPSVISYQNLLRIFFTTHNPTTLNRQGSDTGTQYRSIILYTSPEQRNDIKEIMKELKAEKVFEEPIVTDIRPLESFYEAEDFHKNYYEKNSSEMYCKVIIDPKLTKLRENFAALLK